MVAPTPKKPLFEGNYSLNTQPLFFEFAFEPTAVSFKPQTTLSTPLIRSKRKKVLHAGFRLALGLLITAFIMGSGILNNELLMGKSRTQANIGWIPSWSEDSPPKVDNISVAPLKITETSEPDGNPEALLVGSENNTTLSPIVATDLKETSTNSEPMLVAVESDNAYSSTITTVSDTDETILLSTPIIETTTAIETISETAIAKEPTEIPAPTVPTVMAFKPIIKSPVNHSSVKLSTPVVNREREREAPNKLEVTSEAFHAVNAQSAIDGKKIFIKFGARWCLPCKMMEANVFPDREIRQLLAENYHTLTVDVDNLDGINLRQFYNVETLPSFIILDHNQNIIGRHEGAKRIEELRGILGTAKP